VAGFTRRRLLRLAGAAGAAALAGYGLDGLAGSGSDELVAHAQHSCALTPRDFEDPGFVDGMPERSDIRQDLADGSVKEGTPLVLALGVYGIDASGCRPLPEALVDVWHCDAQGVYSEDANHQTVGRGFLRGNQRADGNGVVQFVTIYPGWYAGRTSHIHFKVRTFSGSQITHDFTSQLYFADSASNEVLSRPAYTPRGPKDTTNARDLFFLNRSVDGRASELMGNHLMLELSRDGEGYVGRFNIGLDLAASADRRRVVSTSRGLLVRVSGTEHDVVFPVAARQHESDGHPVAEAARD